MNKSTQYCQFFYIAHKVKIKYCVMDNPQCQRYSAGTRTFRGMFTGNLNFQGQSSVSCILSLMQGLSMLYFGYSFEYLQCKPDDPLICSLLYFLFLSYSPYVPLLLLCCLFDAPHSCLTSIQASINTNREIYPLFFTVPYSYRLGQGIL